MNDDTQITRVGTLCNPQQFTSVNELRREVHFANARILELALSLDQAKGLNFYLTERIVRLIKAHLVNDQDMILRELEELTGHYQRELEARGMPQ